MADVASPGQRLAEAIQCSTRARVAGESLAATASFGRHWLLLEVAGAWGPNAFRDSPALDPVLGAQLERRASASRLRLVAIRRPGRARHAGGPRHRWARVDATPGSESITWGEAASPSEYLTAPFDQPGTATQRYLTAVCAHGRHDQCCAVRGRAVAAALWQDDPDHVWECSHIGGDRFAATMLLFPHGINYGWADTLDPRHMVSEYKAGRVVLAGLRGRSAFTFLEQAAQDAARRTFGDLRIDAYLPTETRQVAEELWEVDLADADGLVRVELAETVTAPFYSNCAANVALGRPGYTIQAVSRPR